MTKPDPVLPVYEDRVCENPLCNRTYRPRRYWQRFCSSTCRMYSFMDRRLSIQNSLTPKVSKDPNETTQTKMLSDARVGGHEQARQAKIGERAREELKAEDLNLDEATRTIYQAKGIQDWFEKPETKKPTIDDLD